MPFDDLRTALNLAVKTGKIGSPVAARVHVQLAEPVAEPARLLCSLLAMLSPCFPDAPTSLRVRKAKTGNQWNVLLQTPDGQSLFVTIGGTAVKTPSIHLLVIGNHGLAQMNGIDGLASHSELPADSAIPARWVAAITESLRSGRAVSLSAD